MKLKKEFKLRRIEKYGIAIPIGESNSMNGNIILNKTGCFIWELLQTDINKSEILNKLIQKYNINSEDAEKDLEDFLKICFEHELITR